MPGDFLIQKKCFVLLPPLNQHHSVLRVAGAAAALPAAAGTAAASGGVGTGATATASGKRTQSGGQTEACPGPQGPGGAETPQQQQTRSFYIFNS